MLELSNFPICSSNFQILFGNHFHPTMVTCSRSYLNVKKSVENVVH